MQARLIIAPAATGKTTWMIQQLHQRTDPLAQPAAIIVPNPLQARAVRRQLAAHGGAIGIDILLFDQLARYCLHHSRRTVIELRESARYRLLRSIMRNLPLTHFDTLRAAPGFLQQLQLLLAELKAACIEPAALTAAVHTLDAPPRLHDIAAIYTAYQARLQREQWADRAGIAWLAAEALATSDRPTAWHTFWIDGFDNFTEAQIRLLRALTAHHPLHILLTGTPDRHPREAERRFARTRARLEDALPALAEPLPTSFDGTRPAALRHLAEALYAHSAAQLEADAAVELIEADGRGREVRELLRRVKCWLTDDGLAGHDVAIVARNITPYVTHLRQTATEMGVPLFLTNGLPLANNPALAALLTLLRLTLPTTSSESAFERRAVVAIWKSPYFPWDVADAEQIDRLAQQHNVFGGLSLWRAAFAAQQSRRQDDRADYADEAAHVSSDALAGAELQALTERFELFVQQVTPPAEFADYRSFVQWLETLIGDGQGDDDPASLKLLTKVSQGREATRDLAALRAFKELLRGMVWAELYIDGPAAEPLPFATALAEVEAVIAGAVYQPQVATADAVLVTDVPQVRGLPLRRIAVLGMNEGVFPQTLRENPLLRDDERVRLAPVGIMLDPSTESAEQEYFYETITRPSQRLLLTRALIDDNGAAWEPSPYWEEVERLLDVAPQRLTGSAELQPSLAASLSELMLTQAVQASPSVQAWLQSMHAATLDRVDAGKQIITHRAKRLRTPFDGVIDPGHSARHFGDDYTWSASQLETYRKCPHFFYATRVVGLEPAVEPQRGLDAAQTGTLLHNILAGVYNAIDIENRLDLEAVLAALPVVAARQFGAAPRTLGFRPTPWWEATQREMLDKLRNTLTALHVRADGFVPFAFEYKLDDVEIVSADGARLRLRGYIDRIDRRPDGALRVIDYKTGGVNNYGVQQVAAGDVLQLPLYAHALMVSSQLGPVVDGFYWSISKNEAGNFALAGWHGGAAALLDTTVATVFETVANIRQGEFQPRTPQGGCPAYCPAAAWCHHYQPAFQYQ